MATVRSFLVFVETVGHEGNNFFTQLVTVSEKHASNNAEAEAAVTARIPSNRGLVVTGSLEQYKVISEG